MPWLTRLAARSAACAIALSPVVAAAQSDFFAGKTISLLIGTTAGGGYDAYARLLARHMGKHIPGNPSIVPKNMPGAGGLTLANALYARGPKDGTEIATVQNGLPFEKLFQTLSPGGSTALFDATQFGWIGSPTQTVFVTMTWHTSPVKTLRDAMAREATLGATATSSDNYVLAVLSNKLLGTRFKIVSGYDGANAVDLAVERGELDGAAGKDWTTITATRPSWIADKRINIVVQMGMRAHPELGSVPMAIDLARTAEDRAIMELVFAKFGMARPFMTPSGLAPERLALLRRAFDATMKDAAFLAEAAKGKMEVSPVSGEAVEALVKRIMASPPDLASKARAVLN